MWKQEIQNPWIVYNTMGFDFSEQSVLQKYKDEEQCQFKRLKGVIPRCNV